MGQRRAIPHELRRSVLPFAALLLVYFAAGKFGLYFFGLIHPSASAVWIPSGIAIAALLVLGMVASQVPRPQ
jgi:hypothetical protein